MVIIPLRSRLALQLPCNIPQLYATYLEFVLGPFL